MADKESRMSFRNSDQFHEKGLGLYICWECS